ncbi:conserved hypothetical protein [Syntrophobacter sp. SbD1]|nr:conserved hypothetical protein [Syntrophobacter sp. SbD1]
MIPVLSQPEPIDFSHRVRNAGQKFLEHTPRPTTKQWIRKEFWRKVLPDMRSAYNQVCAYCAQWIPHGTGNHSIDHFIPRAAQPALAYEWSNYRYVSSRFNSRKGLSTILDPFTLQHGAFVLDFSSFLIKANPDLAVEQKSLVWNTIDILKLNTDDDLVIERQTWTDDYLAGHITFQFLKKMAPFIAFELHRQGRLLES